MPGNYILGAGVTGLAAAIKTGWPVFEKGEPGGLCRSYERKGFHFEKGGGHWIFRIDKEIEGFLGRFVTLKYYDRRAAVYVDDEFIDYPIQSNIKARTFKDWFTESFGKNLCEKFFYPFHEAYTQGLYDKIAPQDMHKQPSREGYNPRFAYPQEGLSYLIDQMASKCEIRKEEIVSIDPEKRLINGQPYDKIISTIPLNRIMAMIRDDDPDPATSVAVMNIGAEKGCKCPDYHWIYLPRPLYRVGFYSNVNPEFAPPGHVSIYCEGTHMDTVKLLQKWEWIGKIKYADTKFIYPAYTWRMPDSTWREDSIAFLKEKGILQIGRYGAWRFQGIAESIKEGLSV